MNVILLGPQGSGKGTQAELLVNKYGLKHFEAGKILRSVANSDNEYAAIIKGTLDKGALVPDEYVKIIAWDFINKYEGEKGFLFDGYPRHVAQYDQLRDMLMRKGKRIDLVINIEISEPETIKRLSARRTCSKCGEIYNLITAPPPPPATAGQVPHCKCGGELMQREDDKPEAIKRRLEIYRIQTHPVFEKAQQEGIGGEVNGEQSIEKVNQDIVAKIPNA